MCQKKKERKAEKKGGIWAAPHGWAPRTLVVCMKPESRQADKMWNSWRGKEGKFQTNICTCGGSGALKHFHVQDPWKEHTDFCSLIFFSLLLLPCKGPCENVFSKCWFGSVPVAVKPAFDQATCFTIIQIRVSLQYSDLYHFSFCLGYLNSPHMDPCGATNPTVVSLNFSEHTCLQTLWCVLKN